MESKLFANTKNWPKKLVVLLYVLAGFSLVGMCLNYKNNVKAKLVSFLTLVVAVIGLFLAQKGGTSGGKFNIPKLWKIPI